MGEGGAMFVIERLGHALERGAQIYAEIAAGKILAEAHHVTGLDLTNDSLAYLISQTLDAAGLQPEDIGYINAHGTGTQQNDLAESRAIHRAMGRATNLEVTVNREGANMLQGVTTVAVNAANLRGELDDDLLVIEVDEGAFPYAIPEIAPDVVVVHNVFRDQLDRYGELNKVAAALVGTFLGILLAYWQPTSPPSQRDALTTVTHRPGYYTRDEVIERYAQQSGRDVSNVRYYEIFALFKIAVVIQQIYYRWVKGQTSDQRFAAFGARVAYLASHAAQLASLV